MRKPILVTGVAGFLGSNLARMLLDCGYPVVGLDDLSSGLLEQVDPRVSFHRANVRDPAIRPLFDGVDAVFHLAAKNCLSDCQEHPVETADVNVRGTVNVLECARQAGVRKVIYADTSAEYEGVTEFPSCVEVTHPRSVYAVSKAAGAQFVRNYADQFGLRATLLRYFNVYGPAQDWRRAVPPVMSAFIIKLLRGERPVIYGSGEKRRDFIYVDDVNRFHLLALTDSRTDGRTFNVGSGANHSVNDIFKLIAGLLGSDLTAVHEKDFSFEAEITLADISESKKLGWAPQVSIEEGLARSIAYVRERVLAGTGVP